MGIVLGLLRFLLILFVVRLVMRAVHALMNPRGGTAPRPDRGPGGTRMVRDRVCNTFVPEDRALSAAVGGRVEHFCSEACRAKALDELAHAS